MAKEPAEGGCVKLAAKPKHPALVLYDGARRALARAHSIDEVRKIRSKAVALHVYAKQAGDCRLQNMAAEIRLRAERRAGELLREIEKNPGGQPAHKAKNPTGSAKVPVGKPTLEQFGISKKHSADWQKLAAVKEGVFTSAIASTKERNKELTTAGVLRDISGREPRPQRKAPDAEGRTRLVRGFIAKLYRYLPAGREWYEEVDGLLCALAADFSRAALTYGLPGWRVTAAGATPATAVTAAPAKASAFTIRRRGGEVGDGQAVLEAETAKALDRNAGGGPGQAATLVIAESSP